MLRDRYTSEKRAGIESLRSLVQVDERETSPALVICRLAIRPSAPMPVGTNLPLIVSSARELLMIKSMISLAISSRLGEGISNDLRERRERDGNVQRIVAVQAPIPDSITPFSLQRFVDNTQ